MTVLCDNFCFLRFNKVGIMNNMTFSEKKVTFSCSLFSFPRITFLTYRFAHLLLYPIRFLWFFSNLISCELKNRVSKDTSFDIRFLLLMRIVSIRDILFKNTLITYSHGSDLKQYLNLLRSSVPVQMLFQLRQRSVQNRILHHTDG